VKTRRPTTTLLVAAMLPFAGLAAQEPGRTQADHRFAGLADALIEHAVPSRDDADAVAGRLIDAAAAVGRSAAAALAVEAVGTLVDDIDRPGEIEAALADLIAARPHALAEHAAEVLRERLLRWLGREREADAIAPYASFASHFVVVGPFGDGGDWFTGVPFPPELSFPSHGTVLQGRFGPVSRYTVERRPHERSVALARRGRSERGCFYALHRFELPVATQTWIELTTRGSFELFVNGHRVERLDRYESNVPNRLWLPATLVPGVNHVLVKTTHAEHDDLALRYLDAAGRPLPGLIERRDADTARSNAGPDDRLPDPAPLTDPLRALDAAAAVASGTVRDSLRVAALLATFATGHGSRGLELLHELDLDLPEDPRLRLAIARAWTGARELPFEIRSGRSRSLRESVAGALPHHHHALMQQAATLEDDDRPEEAVRLLLAHLDAGGGRATFARLHALTTRLGFRAEAEGVRERWLRSHPNDPRATLATLDARQTGGDHRGAFAAVNAALERLPGHATLQARALELAIQLGEARVAEQLTRLLGRDDPDGVAGLRRMATTERRLGDRDRSLDLFGRIAVDEAASASDVRDAGTWLLRGGRRAAALAAFRRSIELDGSQHDLRRLVTRLADDGDDFPEIAGFRYDGDDVIARFVPSGRERAAASTLVLDQMIVRFHADGSRVEETHTIRRINDLRGVEAYEEAQRAARAGELVRLRTVAPDGRSYVPSRVAGTFSMPRLAPGAFVEEVYREFLPPPGAAPWRGPEFHFQSEREPYLLTELVVILPPSHPGTFRNRGFPGEPETSELPSGDQAFVFRLRDVPRIEHENLMPPLEEVVPNSVYGQDRSIGEVAREQWVRAVYGSRSSPWVAAATRAAIADIDGDLARARRVYEFAHDLVPDGRGAPDPTAILLRKQGPRFWLLLAMLREAEVPFRHAAAQPTPEQLRSEAPSGFVGDDTYDVPAALLEPRDGPPLWLFVDTPRHAPIGAIAAERAGAPVILVGPGGRHELRRLPARDPELDIGWQVGGELALDASGTASLTARVAMLGQSGFELAERIRNLEDDRRKLVGRSLAAQVFPGWTVVESSLARPATGERMQASVRLERRGALQPAGDEFALPLPLPASDLFQRYGDRGKRALPLRLTEIGRESWTVTVEPGTDLAIVGIPESVRVCTELLDYTLSFALLDGRLRIRRTIENRPGSIPATRFAEWVALLTRLDQAEQARIRIARR
jgi:tetratricopeptide (TPR) repeat protein